ncbi:hypothetical protein GMOD_00006131 [Pyrenophora seminiperda CCB06]|uniref:Uncharacterized protein n=1 Tax=Pyrenophora seminiperda CCB06 TaxID=1302712 RepID=A0A3M7M4N7_9PLEO|nr:hypothetical protein GMOD_00006131 [Pyrenophora seminiperda CCB06]
MKLYRSLLTLLLCRQVAGFDLALAAAISRSDAATYTITKTVYYTEVRRLSKNNTSQLSSGDLKVAATEPLIKRDKTIDSKSKFTREGHNDLYKLRVYLASEGHISIYVSGIAVSSFCDGVLNEGDNTPDLQELHLAIRNVAKSVSIPVRKEHAMSFCRVVEGGDGLTGSKTSSNGTATDTASTKEPGTTPSEEDSSKSTKTTHKLKGSKNAGSETGLNSSKASTPTPSASATNSPVSGTGDTDDNSDTSESATQLSPSISTSYVASATHKSKSKTSSNAMSSSTSSDDTADASTTLDSSSSSETPSADTVPTDRKTSSADLTASQDSTVSQDSTTSQASADESGDLVNSTSSKKKKAHSTPDTSASQPTDDASSPQPTIQTSSTENSSDDSSTSDDDNSTPSTTLIPTLASPLAIVQGAADPPPNPAIPHLTVSSMNSWYNVINSYMSTAAASATVEPDVVATPGTVVSTNSENGAVRRTANPSMYTAGSPTQILQLAKIRSTTRSSPSSNAGKRVVPPSLLWWRSKVQEDDDDESTETQEDTDKQPPTRTHSEFTPTEADESGPTITKMGKSKGKGKPGDTDKEKSKGEKSKSKSDKDEDKDKETGKDTTTTQPKETPRPKPQDQDQDQEQDQNKNKAADQPFSTTKDSESIPTLPSDVSFALATSATPPPSTTSTHHSSSAIPSPPSVPPDTSGPIIWDPDCMPLHPSPSSPSAKRAIKGCWRTVAQAPPLSSDAWNILSDKQNRQLVVVLWCVLAGMMVQFLMEFLAMRGGEWGGW